MLAILNFIFRDFWTWLGTVILLYAAGDCLQAMIARLRGK